MSPHADATTTCQDNFQVGREVNGFGVTISFMSSQSMAGQGTSRVAAPSPQSVVGTHNASPTAKPDHPAPLVV